jgi:molybdopterin-guanine dinucleotide biosynthesis protein A
MFARKIETATAKKIPHSPIGIVLAGGQSSRMGKDKALLTLHGETFLSLAEQTLLGAGCGRILLSGEPRTAWHGQHVADMYAGLGPVGGMVSCLDVLTKELPRDTPVVFVAVDTPLLSSQSLTPLVRAASQGTGAHYADHPIPLVLRLTQSVLVHTQTVKQQLMHGRSFSIAAFTGPLGLNQLIPDTQQGLALRNINTPEEWRRLNHERADQPR